MDYSRVPSGGPIELRARYDWSTTSPSAAVIDAVTRATSEEPTTFGPLYESVDPDALDSLIRTVKPELGPGETTLSFGFADLHVTVRSSGSIVVRRGERE